jgi:hypothetical protein
MILPGILASQISGHLGGDYESISTATVGSGGSSYVEFTSIPATYKHLQIRALFKGSAYSNMQMTFNSDSGSNYSWHEVYGDGSVTGATGYSNTLFIAAALGNSTTSYPTATTVDVLDYANTSKYKTSRSLSGTDSNGSTDYILLRSGSWRNTAAISTIRLTAAVGTFAQYSLFALYGIKE